MNLPPFARVRAFLGLIVLAFMSIYKPRQAYEMIHEACRSNDFKSAKSDEEKTDASRFMNIYGQESWGDEAVIAGSKRALIELRESIDTMIIDGTAAANIELKASDGEKFSLLITVSPEIERLSVPYFGEDACEGRLKTFKPGTSIS